MASRDMNRRAVGAVRRTRRWTRTDAVVEDGGGENERETVARGVQVSVDAGVDEQEVGWDDCGVDAKTGEGRVVASTAVKDVPALTVTLDFGKLASVCCGSEVNIEIADNDLYVAKIGDEVIVKLGSRYEVPDDLLRELDDFQLATCGDDYAVWVRKNLLDDIASSRSLDVRDA